jgi:adenine-specific DNA-methyltransferase
MKTTTLDGKTPDIAEENIGKLKQLFPEVFTEGKIDFEKLQQVLGEYVEDSNERYNFTWNGKGRALRLSQTPSLGTLRPCKEESKDWDTTQNLYIEGDNLEVLKLLQKSYYGKVKMIYIDPPYNTGKDFVYKDDFHDSLENYKKITGQVDSDGNRISTNTEASGRYHTDWLNMMYPRLRLARNLLTDDGVIFISIDDNEVDNLKKICNEVFGEDNFNKLSTFTVPIKFAKESMPDAYKGFVKDIRIDERGEFAVGDTLYNHNRIFNEETRPNLVFSIYYNPDTGELIPDNIGINKPGFVEIKPHKNGDGTHKYHAWRWSRQKIVNESYDLIVLKTNSGGYEIYTKIRDFNTTVLKDIITNISNGDSEFKLLFEGRKCFDYPKYNSRFLLWISYHCSCCNAT